MLYMVKSENEMETPTISVIWKWHIIISRRLISDDRVDQNNDH